MNVTKQILIIVLLLSLASCSRQVYYEHTDKTLPIAVIEQLMSECNQLKHSVLDDGIERCMKEKGFEKKTRYVFYQ